MFEVHVSQARDIIRRQEKAVGLSPSQFNALPESEKVRNEEGEAWYRSAEHAILQVFGPTSQELAQWNRIDKEFLKRAEYGPGGYIWRYTALRAVLEEFDSKLRVARELRPTSTSTTVINSHGDVFMPTGDSYHITKSQVGAIGPAAQAIGNQLQQAWQGMSAYKDLSALATELATLRQALMEQAAEPEHHMAIGAVGAAEAAARKGDGASVFDYLKRGGSWAFDIATKIGVSLASSALKGALGLT